MKKGFLGSITGTVSNVAKGAVSATAGVVTYYLSKEEEKPMEIGTPYNFQHVYHGVNADFRSGPPPAVVHLAPPAPLPVPSAPLLPIEIEKFEIDRVEIEDAVYLIRRGPHRACQFGAHG